MKLDLESFKLDIKNNILGMRDDIKNNVCIHKDKPTCLDNRNSELLTEMKMNENDERTKHEIRLLNVQLEGAKKQCSYFESLSDRLQNQLRDLNRVNRELDVHVCPVSESTRRVNSPSNVHNTANAHIDSFQYYLSQGIHDPLSNFYPCKLEISIDGRSFLYNSVEQAFQHRKAKFLRDQATAIKILQSSRSAAAKSWGDMLSSHPNISEWIKIEQKVMVELLHKKAEVCKSFREKLIQSGQAQIYHTVPDTKWGIGLHAAEIRHPLDPTAIRGKNLAGTILMAVRNVLKGGDKVVPSPTRFLYSDKIVSSPTRLYSEALTQSSIPILPRKKRVDLIGSSILKDVDESSLSSSADVYKTTAYTIPEALNLDIKKMKSDLIILQLTTNDLKVNSVENVVDGMKSLVTNIQKSLPKCKLALSMAPFQRTGGDINQKIHVVNSTLHLIYKHSDVITFSNVNIDPNRGCLNLDGLHLSRRGSSVLASNLRSIIQVSLFPHSDRVGLSRYRPSQSLSHRQLY